MYPYPSGDLHIGHWYIVTPTDALARFRRMHGYNVFFPIGFDAFGLPAENAAIKSGIHPCDWTMQNIEHDAPPAPVDGRDVRLVARGRHRRSRRTTAGTSGCSCASSRPGLAYRAMAPVDWCPNDGMLAREQVEGADRHCWRCGALVEKRDLEQWFFRTTTYADELLDFTRHRLARADPGPCRPTGSAAPRAPRSTSRSRPTTTSPAATSCASSRPGRTRCSARRSWSWRPEHPLVATLTAPDRRAEVDAYVEQARRRTEIERLSTEREKTGVSLGADAINPVNGERIPIWIADYVLAGYGTGAIMAVPAHDERDFEFAKRFGLPIRRVVAAPGVEAADAPMDGAYVAHAAGRASGQLGRFDGMPADEGGKAIVA